MIERASTIAIGDDPNQFKTKRTKDTYRHQFSHLYYSRLNLLRPDVQEAAQVKWKEAEYSEHVSEIKRGKMCWTVGTIFMDMPLKPDVIEEACRDSELPPLEKRVKIYSPDDKVIMEDESGRIRLVGKLLQSAMLVTGVICAALGTETAKGEFEVADFCYAGLTPQNLVDESGSSTGETEQKDEWIAAVSGLLLGIPTPADSLIQMLVEYLTGEGSSEAESQFAASNIARLFVLGDSMVTIIEEIEVDEKKLKYGQETTTYSDVPLNTLTSCLQEVARSLPVHVLPGGIDLAGGTLPQQAWPKGMFGPMISDIPAFSTETNPTYLTVETTREDRPVVSRRLLLNSGQPLNDMASYFPTPPITRLGLLEATLRWRHVAPTAPDTLYCFPYTHEDPFIMDSTPDLYIVGGQPKFGTKLVKEKIEGNGEARCRLVLVPSFSATGTIVLVNLRTLEVRTITFKVSESLVGPPPDPNISTTDETATHSGTDGGI
ncbi:DNA polymerase alpha/epsilon subunit B-domain-containing protein [Flagelloscypha sp. PMI_526]|nr:DNA polymerase alpha/epsilon subunit B-domain-containing protein [Flagelloscypha sp. PMI_526]